MVQTLERTRAIDHTQFSSKSLNMAAIPPQDVGIDMRLLQRPKKERLGSQAFDLEYDSPPTKAELRRDIVSYLGEYRLQVQKHSYDLVFGRDIHHRGEVTLRDEDRGESLALKAKRTLASRKLEGKPLHREVAEEKGIASLNEQLRTARAGDTVIWASPPGPKEQGYGEYGFLYTGKVGQLANGEKQVAMSAIRVEKPKAIADQDAWTYRFSELVNNLTGEEQRYANPEAFLQSPKVLHEPIDPRMIDVYIQRSFSFAPDASEKQRINAILQKMEPYIAGFITRMSEGTRAERLTAFHALENYALLLKKQADESGAANIIYQIHIPAPRYDEMVKMYGYTPPKVAGSCGSTGESTVSNHISSLSRSSINAMLGLGGAGEDERGSLEFKCTEGHVNKRQPGEILKTCQTENCSGSVGC